MATTAARVAADSQFFDSMLTLIPVSYYYPTQQEDQGSKFMHNKGAKAGAGAAHKGRKRSATEEANGSTVKKTRTVEEKQSQFDPANYKTVLDVQKANFPAEAPKAKSKPKKPANKPVVVKESEPKEEQNTKPQAASSMDDLRKRLHDKINMLRSGRRPEPTKQQQEHKKQAKKQKQSKPLAQKKPKREETTENTDKPKPAATGKPNLDFKFASLKPSDEKAEKFKGRRRDTNAKALQKLEHYNQYMSKLEAEDPEKAKALKHQKQYQASILRAQGVTVKDDAKMLKNAIRKAEKRTKKSQKEWKERSKDVKQALKNKQIKRNENLAARAKGKKKKGRPGFEGSGTFLN